MIQNVLSLQESNQDGTRVSEARKVEKQIWRCLIKTGFKELLEGGRGLCVKKQVKDGKSVQWVDFDLEERRAKSR